MKRTLVATAAALTLVLTLSASSCGAPTEREACEKAGGIWEYDNDLSNALATSKPRSRVRSTSNPKVKVTGGPPVVHTTTHTVRPAARGGWECDLDGDDD